MDDRTSIDPFTEISIVDRGDLANPATRLSILDGGFDQRQIVFAAYEMVLGDR